MNFPMQNKLQLKHLEEMASNDWANVPHAQQAAQQAMKMKAALELVLAFHSGEPWSHESVSKWLSLQRDAGVLHPSETATTRVLCDTIREVLGLKEERWRGSFCNPIY